jgi:hypothetical protein
MEAYSEAVRNAAITMRFQANNMVGAYSPVEGWFGRLRVPPHWTAWLLMEKAGMPRDLIADVSHEKEQHLARKLRFARAMLMLPPYAGRIEELSGRLGRFLVAQRPGVARARAVRCVM